MLGMFSYPRRPKSGQITCYLNRTYHVLTTNGKRLVASTRKPGVTCPSGSQSNGVHGSSVALTQRILRYYHLINNKHEDQPRPGLVAVTFCEYEVFFQLVSGRHSRRSISGDFGGDPRLSEFPEALFFCASPGPRPDRVQRLARSPPA